MKRLNLAGHNALSRGRGEIICVRAGDAFRRSFLVSLVAGGLIWVSGLGGDARARGSRRLASAIPSFARVLSIDEAHLRGILSRGARLACGSGGRSASLEIALGVGI